MGIRQSYKHRRISRLGVTVSFREPTTNNYTDKSYISLCYQMVAGFETGGSTDVIRVGFTLNGVNGNPASRSNYFHLSGSQSTERLELKVTEVFCAQRQGHVQLL